MADKYIIDGIDVAKCRYFTSEWDFNNCGHICKGTECKYKRLWYKKQLDQLKVENDRLTDELDRLKAENKKLKADLKSLEYTVILQSNRDIDNATDLFAKRIAKIENENSILKAELEQEKSLKEMYFTYYKTKHSDIKGEFFKLKQTLSEIKEITLGVRNYLDCPSPKDVRYEMDIILRKISEVNNDRQS